MRLVCETDAFSFLQPELRFSCFASSLLVERTKEHLKHKPLLPSCSFRAPWKYFTKFKYLKNEIVDQREERKVRLRRNWIGFHRISSLSPVRTRDVPDSRGTHGTHTRSPGLREIVTWRVYHRQAVHGRRR